MVAVSTFYMDDSGTRHPDRKTRIAHHKHDWFALGGILISDENINAAKQQIVEFRSRWPKLGEHPLHSSDIRGCHEKFAWLGVDNILRTEFLTDLHKLLVSLPVIGLACVIDRPGYNHRYEEKYKEKRWLLCKSAFDIVVERAAKHSNEQGRKLRIWVEGASKSDDKLLRSYYDNLKAKGASFNPSTSSKYTPFNSVDYSTTLYEFRIKSKSSNLMQIADIFLWPMCIGGYDKDNRPYTALKAAGKYIDCVIPEESLPERGIKYYCFDLVGKGAETQKPSDDTHPSALSAATLR